MKKEIEIIIDKKYWNNFFDEILWDFNGKIKLNLIKIILKNIKINNENINLWIFFAIKKQEDNKKYWNLVFWLESEKWVSQVTIKLVRKKITDFLVKNQDLSIDKDWISTDLGLITSIWCWIMNFSLENYENFIKSIKMIYELFYFDILGYDWKQTVFIDNNLIIDSTINTIEKKYLDDENPKIPYWLEWKWLEWNNNKMSKNIPEKYLLEDMWWNKNLKIEIWKLISFYKNKEHFKRWNIEPPRWVILYWPPWTWKTLTAKIIASEIKVNFYTLSSTDIMTKWIWESARNLKDFFKKIETPCIVFMDEIDAIAPNRDWNKSWREPHEEEIQTINALLQEIDGFWEKKDILFIGATNRIDAVDPAVLRAWRLDYKIFVDYPDFEARKEIWNIYLTKAYKKTNYKFLDEKVDLDVLANRTDKFTWSDINEIVRRLLSDYAVWSLFSSKVNWIISWETTFKGLLYLIDKYKNEKIINRNIVPIKPESRLSDIWWSIDLKKQISLLVKQYKDKELYEKMWANLPRWIILYWPPWTWKTLAAKVIAWEIWQIFYNIKASDIQSSITNRSVENLKNIFDQIESPSIVFIDEIDSLARSRNKEDFSTSEEDKKILNMLLQYIDWFSQKKDILFIWATNSIETIDIALLRAGRFDYKILVDYPDEEARKEIWNIYLTKAYKKTNYDFLGDTLDLVKLSKLTERFTWSDINEIVRRLLNEIAIWKLESLREKWLLNWEIILKNISEIIWEYKKEKVFNNDILPTVPDITLKDIWGSNILKEELKKVINQYQNKDIFEEIWVNLPRWILLYWPPWTWKTLAAKALAWEVWQIFYTLKWSDFLSQRVNHSVEKLDKIFKEIQTPSIVFIDEIDSIWRKRGDGMNSHNEDRKLLTTFLQHIDWFWDKKDILFIWATNNIDSLDEALLRAGRFDYKILVDYPDEEARKEIWKIYIEKSKTKSQKINIFDKNINYDALSQKTDKLTWSDINEIVRRLKERLAINESKNFDIKTKKLKFSHFISNDEILAEIQKYREESLFQDENKKIGFNI